jgi:predicted small secreted protein
MKQKSLKTILSFALMSTFLLSGCNTIQGIGKDVQSAGKGIERGADTVRESIKDDDK